MAKTGLFALTLSLLVAAPAAADVVFLNPQGLANYPPGKKAADVSNLQTQFPALRVHTTSSGNDYIFGRIEGFDRTPYTWTTSVLRSAGAGAVVAPTEIVFRVRQSSRLAPVTINIPLAEVAVIEHEVDHPFDLALLFGDRGLPDTTPWKASLRRALDAPTLGGGNLLPGLGSTTGAARATMVGAAVQYLIQPLNVVANGAPPVDETAAARAALNAAINGQPVPTDPRMAASLNLASSFAARGDPTLTLGGQPRAVARQLLIGLALAGEFPALTGPYLPPPPGGGTAAQALQTFVRAMEDCLRLLCRLVAVAPDANVDASVRNTHYHIAGTAARGAVLELIGRAASGTFHADFDIPNGLRLRQAIGLLRPTEDLSDLDIKRLKGRYAAVRWGNVQPPTAFPHDLLLTPSKIGLYAVRELREEPSWWVIHPDADDSYGLVRALVEVAPLTNAGTPGVRLPDPRNADGAPANGDLTLPSGDRIELGGEALLTLSLLLHDPRQGQGDEHGRAKANEIAAWTKNDFADQVEQAVSVFGDHALDTAGTRSYGQQRFLNEALLLSGRSGFSLSATADSVAKLVSVATRTPPPTPTAGEGEADEEDDGWGVSEEDDDAPPPGSGDVEESKEETAQALAYAQHRRSKRQEYATKSLMTLASFQGSGGKPAPVASMVLDELMGLQVRMIRGQANPGEVELLQLLRRLSDDDSPGNEEWSNRAKLTRGLVRERMKERREELREKMRAAQEEVAQMEQSSTDAELQAANQKLQELQDELKAMEGKQ